MWINEKNEIYGKSVSEMLDDPELLSDPKLIALILADGPDTVDVSGFEDSDKLLPYRFPTAELA